MVSVDALPIDNRVEVVIARQMRTVHDTAVFRLADYGPTVGDGWVIAAFEPASDSGVSYVPGEYVQAETGKVVQPAGSQTIVRMKGAWRVIEAADGSLPASTPYDWSKPLLHRVRVKQPENYYPLFTAGGAAVFEWEPIAQGEQQFGAVRMIYPEWARDAAQLLQSAATSDAAIAALEKAGPASAQADALLGSPNGLTATIALRTLLRSDSPQALVARMPALLRDSDARRLGVFVYACLMESDAAIRELLVPVIRSEIESTTDANRLGAITYAAYAASNYSRFDQDKRQTAIDVVADVQRRGAALHVPVNATAPWTLIFEWLGVLPPHTFVR